MLKAAMIFRNTWSREMYVCKAASIVATLAMLAGGLASLPVQASTSDIKTISPTRCTPLGPGTTVAELTINSYGVFNPGDTNETVLCEIPVDSDVSWFATPGQSGIVRIDYRAGAIAGKVSCTAFAGSTVAVAGATFAETSSPATQAAGARGFYSLHLAEPTGLYTAAPPTNVQCTLTPKAALGSITLYEYETTNTP
jgi:hypothetical protein